MKLETAFVAWFTLSVMAVISPILGVAFGALAGWAVGLVFGDTILRFLAALGIEGFAMWQIGAALGFIGGFFKSHHVSRD